MKLPGQRLGMAALSLMLAVASLSAAPLTAAPRNTPSGPAEVYFAFHDALPRAETLDALLPYLCQKQREKVGSAPADQQAVMLSMLKQFRVDNVKLVKVVPRGADRAEVYVEGFGVNALTPNSPPERQFGRIEMAREKGEWKFYKEHWGSDNRPPQ